MTSLRTINQSTCVPSRSFARNLPRTKQRHSPSRALPELFSLADIAPQVATTANQVAGQANELLPGSVSAPDWVVPVGAAIITIVGGGFAILLNPGSEAAEKIFERDAKKAAFKAKSGAVGRGKQMVTKRGRK